MHRSILGAQVRGGPGPTPPRVVDLDGPKLGVLGQALGSRLGASLPPQTALGVAGLAMPDILVEMEALAVRT